MKKLLSLNVTASPPNDATRYICHLIDHHPETQHLFKFVQKNTRFTPALVDIHLNKQHVIPNLIDGLNKNQHLHPLLNDELTEFYLIYALITEKIDSENFDKGMMISLMNKQFNPTYLHPVTSAKFPDGFPSFPSKTTVTCASFYDELNQLTPEGARYLNSILESKKASSVQVSAITEALKSVPKHHCVFWLISMNQLTKNFHSEIYKGQLQWFRVLGGLNTPFLPYFENNKQVSGHLYSPSPAVFACFLKGLIPDINTPISPFYQFGKIGTTTIVELHNASQHPIPLHSNVFNTNTLGVHGFKSGTFSTAVHDRYHQYLTSFIPDKLRPKLGAIFDYLTPHLLNKDPMVKQAIHTLAYRCMDLEEIGTYFENRTRKDPRYTQLCTGANTQRFDNASEGASKKESDATLMQHISVTAIDWLISKLDDDIQKEIRDLINY